MSSIRAAVVTLTGGAVVARVTAFLVTLLVARTFGRERFGDYSAAIQIGSVVALLVHGGVQSVAAREAALHPAAASSWIRASVRARVRVAVAAYAVLAAVVLSVSADPALLLIAGALVLPAAFDLKGLADAVGRTRMEVLLESAAGIAQLLFVLVLYATGRVTPEWLATAYVAGRGVYAAGVVWQLRSFAPDTIRPSLRALVFGTGGPVSIAYAAERLTASSDVILIHALAGAGPAGLFAAADKVTQAAVMPLSLLGRAFSPHLQHAVAKGDARATMERALRASAYAIVPIAAGGWVVAEPLLVRIFGPEYAGGGWTLRWLLVAATVSGVGWRFADALFALRRVRGYVTPLYTSVAVNWTASLLLIPRFGSAGSSLGTAVAQCVAMPLSWALARRAFVFGVVRPLLPAAALAVVTAAAAWAVPGEWGALARVAGGGLAFGAGIWWLELRRGWGALGQAMETSSGLAEEWRKQ